VTVGEASPEAKELLKTTAGALDAGINAAQSGARLGDVSAAIQRFAESRGFSVVREYTGHGIGREMHEEPQIPNFGLPNSGPVLKKGMVLAIEPMVNRGGWRTRLSDDNWTVLTADGSLSAHFEHTVAITDGEPEVLTKEVYA
jgi:methionyl aminopeptidase